MTPFLESLARKEQIEHAQTFVQGLLSDLEHKNVESIAYRFGQDRTPLQRFVGFSKWDHEPLQDELVRQERVIFAVRHMEVDFRRPARFNESLVVTVELAEKRRVSLTLAQTIRRQSDGELLVRGRAQVACVHADKLRPCAIPEYQGAHIASLLFPCKGKLWVYGK